MRFLKWWLTLGVAFASSGNETDASSDTADSIEQSSSCCERLAACGSVLWTTFGFCVFVFDLLTSLGLSQVCLARSPIDLSDITEAPLEVFDLPGVVQAELEHGAEKTADSARDAFEAAMIDPFAFKADEDIDDGGIHTELAKSQGKTEKFDYSCVCDELCEIKKVFSFKADQLPQVPDAPPDVFDRAESLFKVLQFVIAVTLDNEPFNGNDTQKKSCCLKCGVALPSRYAASGNGGKLSELGYVVVSGWKDKAKEKKIFKKIFRELQAAAFGLCQLRPAVQLLLFSGDPIVNDELFAVLDKTVTLPLIRASLQYENLMMSTAPAAADVFDRMSEIPTLADMIRWLESLEGQELLWKDMHVTVGILGRVAQQVLLLLNRKYGVKTERNGLKILKDFRLKVVKYFGVRR